MNLYSDRQWTTQRLLGFCENESGPVFDCICKLSELEALIWVPEHSGIEADREADMLAQKGRDQPVECHWNLPKRNTTLLTQWHKLH